MRPTLPAKHFVSCTDLDGGVGCCTGCHDEHEEGYNNILDQTSRTDHMFCCKRNPEISSVGDSRDWERDLVAKALRNKRAEELKESA